MNHREMALDAYDIIGVEDGLVKVAFEGFIKADFYYDHDRDDSTGRESCNLKSVQADIYGTGKPVEVLHVMRPETKCLFEFRICELIAQDNYFDRMYGAM